MKTELATIEASAVACCTPVAAEEFTPSESKTLASVFKALADPSRISIVNMLANAEAPVCVCEFMPRLGLSQGTVSFHLKKLLDVGLLEREQRGTWAYYSLDRQALSRLATVFVKEEARDEAGDCDTRRGARPLRRVRAGRGHRGRGLRLRPPGDVVLR